MEDLVAPYPSPADEQQTKKHPAKRIGRGIAAAATVSSLAYCTWNFSNGPQKQRKLAVSMEKGER